jgi:hypothetical protein
MAVASKTLAARKEFKKIEFFLIISKFYQMTEYFHQWISTALDTAEWLQIPNL